MQPSVAPLTYDDVRRLAAELNRPASTLIALSEQNDPFYLPPARVRDAEWFAGLWEMYALAGRRIHLRRPHYWLISLPEASRPRKPDGAPYENTKDDWKLLGRASVGARALCLVDAGAFVDRRNGEPLIFTPTDEDRAAAITALPADVAPPKSETSPLFTYSATPDNFPSLPAGYEVEEPEIAEPYEIEIWIEKSTVDDILVPICQRHRVNLVTGLGELSYTRCLELVERVRADGRKTRILYGSDFDGAGDCMPVSIARKIEFILRREGLDLDIKLRPLFLTREQVERYHLPRSPIKETDRRKAGFEERHGEGAVELDALEALHPGELARIVEGAIAVYREPAEAVREKIEALADDFRERCDDIRDEVIDRRAETLAQLRAEFQTMQAAIAEHQETLTAISAEIAERNKMRTDTAIEAINALRAEFAERAEEVFAAINEDIEDSVPDPDDVDWPTAEDAEADEDDAEQLYDSARGYVEQIGFYKRHQGKPIARRRKGHDTNSGAP